MNQPTDLDALIVFGAGKIESERRARYAAKIGFNFRYPIIVSGGRVLFSNSRHTEAEIMRKALESCGIDCSRIYLERNAENTSENIEFSRNLLAFFRKARRIGLVTSRTHMPRVRELSREKLRDYYLEYLAVESRNLRDYSAEAITYACEIAGKGLRFVSGNDEGFCSFLKDWAR